MALYSIKFALPYLVASAKTQVKDDVNEYGEALTTWIISVLQIIPAVNYCLNQYGLGPLAAERRFREEKNMTRGFLRLPPGECLCLHGVNTGS
jgi:hypothetical protein